jgi:hypothetical protein
MPIFPTTKTVPLAKDLASSSTFTQALGVNTARTDLDTILAAIDQAIATEISNRTTGDSTNATNLSNHINSTTAHAAVNIVNAPSGAMTQTNVQAAINSLQTQVSASAPATSLSAETTRATTAEALLQTEIDGERAPLRMTADGTSSIVSIASSKGTRTDSTGGASLIVVMNGALVSDFIGASINFSTGTITYTSGQASGSFTPISFAGQASKVAKYAIVLLPGSPNTLLVLNGSSFGTTASTASEPAASGGVLVGFVAVKDNGSAGVGTINNISQTALEQSQASGSGSGSGSGSPLDPQADETFVYYTRSDFAVDSNKFVGSTTGTDQTLGLSKVSLAAGNTFISKDLTGSQIKADGTIINTVQGRLMYNIGKIDSAPTVQFSRDGGATYQTATVSQVASVSNIIEADLTFTDTTPLFNGGTANASLSSGQQVAAMFTPSYNMIMTNFAALVSTTATAGTVVYKLYSVASGTPNAVLATSGTTFAAGQDIKSTPAYVTGSFTPIALTAGTQYALVLVGAGLNANISVGQVSSAPSFSTGSSTNNGSGYVASGTNIAYQVNGAGVDLRMKVIASAISELSGFGVEYVVFGPSALQGIASYETRTITSTEASTGNITLSVVQYTPGAHQLFAAQNGHVFMAPDFIETSPNTVSFGTGFFQPGDVVSFYNGYGLVDGSSQALSKVNSFYDAIVGSAAQVSGGVATHSSLQTAINTFPTGTILILRGYVTNEAITISTTGLFIEGQGYNTQIPGTVTFTAAAQFNMIEWIRFNGNVTLASGSTGNFIRDSFLAPAASLSDLGAGNSKLLVVG